MLKLTLLTYNLNIKLFPSHFILKSYTLVKDSTECILKETEQPLAVLYFKEKMCPNFNKYDLVFLKIIKMSAFGNVGYVYKTNTFCYYFKLKYDWL